VVILSDLMAAVARLGYICRDWIEICGMFVFNLKVQGDGFQNLCSTEVYGVSKLGSPV
jgi:hypothetical protein